jgi:hypothetical protein
LVGCTIHLEILNAVSQVRANLNDKNNQPTRTGAAWRETMVEGNHEQRPKWYRHILRLRWHVAFHGLLWILVILAVGIWAWKTNGKAIAEVSDRLGTRLGTIPNDTTSSVFRSDLGRAFDGATLPDDDGIVAIVSNPMGAG